MILEEAIMHAAVTPSEGTAAQKATEIRFIAMELGDLLELAAAAPDNAPGVDGAVCCGRRLLRVIEGLACEIQAAEEGPAAVVAAPEAKGKQPAARRRDKRSR